MIRPLVFIGLIILITYVVIPGIGAFIVRSSWRRFRRWVESASLRPFVRYKDIRSSSDFLGEFSFLGSLEAIQEDKIWIKNEKLSLSAEMHQCNVYVLPSQTDALQEGRVESNDEVLPDEMPKKISWNNIFTLPEGTRVFVSGILFLRNGRPCFCSTKEHPLLLIIYDGFENTILRRSIRGGRQKNEYWNQFTPLSLLIGFFSLVIYAYVLYRNPMMRLPVLGALTGSLLPIIGFLPPGILFLFAYRYFWKQGRTLRAERDLLLLPLRYFSREDLERPFCKTVLPDGFQYSMKKISGTAEKALLHCSEGVKVRESSLFKRGSMEHPSFCYIFGEAENGDGNALFRQPGNPMAEFIIIPGNPAELSDECSRRARRYELLSGGSLAAGMLLNTMLSVTILHFLIK